MKISKSVDFICSIKEKIIKSEDLSVVELEHLDKIMTFFKVDKISSLILCLTVKKHFYGKRLNTSKLFDSLNYNLEQIIDLKNNIKLLQKKGWLVVSNKSILSRNDRVQEITPLKKITKAIAENDATILEPQNLDDLSLILINGNELLMQLSRNFCDIELIESYLEYYEPYSSHDYIKNIYFHTQLKDFEKCILLWMSGEVLKFKNSFDFDDLIHVFLDSGAIYKIKNSIFEGTSILFSQKFIEYNRPNFIDLSDIKLGEKLYTQLESLGLIKNKQNFNSKLLLQITPDDIPEKQLFFNPETESELSKIINLLKEDNYQKVIERFKLNNMTPSLTMLFYGVPGVGKTEFVKQIARQTKRMIFLVDISSIKNMWVGESEKNMNAIFRQYHLYSKKMDTTPILLFNEADGLLNLRVDTKGAVDQMMNAMQNILLQNLEDFKGIFVATSNLINNIDGAFDRRINYKYKFDMPNSETKNKILNHEFKLLNPKLIEYVAKEYDITGGQIQNIKKRMEADSILFELDTYNDTSFIKYVEDEVNFRNEQKQKIGF